MTYPFTQPIRDYDEATLASQSAFWWPAHTAEALDHIGDRLIEIVIYRAEMLWRDIHSKEPSILAIEPTFITQRHDPMLLAPAGNAHNFFPGVIAALPDVRYGTGFFDEASCLNLMGSMQMGELLRRILCARFGLPVGTSELNHISSSWPTLPLWNGTQAVLDRLMTPEHRVRREAGLLELETPPTTKLSEQRRL